MRSSPAREKSLGDRFYFQIALNEFEIDANLAHYIHHNRMNALCGLCASGDALSLRRVGKLIEKCGRHLRTPGVVNTGKDEGPHCAILLMD